MNVFEKHVVTGMTTDMNVSRFSNDKVLDARNIRITKITDGQELLCVTNEKGTVRYTLRDASSQQGEPITFLVGETVVGSAQLGTYLIVFSHTDEATDRIFRVDTIDHTCKILFTGNLGLSYETSMETLPVYENESVQKVYWIDGVHQMRCINILSESITASGDEYYGYDVNPTINFNHSISVIKNNTGGEFPAGTVQYAFTYHNLYGPETNIFETTPLYLLSPKTLGVAADGRTTCSFNITLTDLDTNFQYVRAYAIIRTSENATPSVRILGDYQVASTVNILDDGVIGSSVDSTYLLFVGGEPVAPSTFTTKDGTLFLGNVKLLKKSLSEILTFGSNVGTISNTLYTKPDYSKDLWYYDYSPNNNAPSTEKRVFKWGETYRLGFIAQHNTGIWSDVFWIGDRVNTISPKFANDPVNSKHGIFTLSLNAATKKALTDNGFVRIAPVAVCPTGKDRSVFCQGLVSATVFNIRDRYYNRPYSQASWFFRPLQEGWGMAALPFSTLHSTYEHSGGGQGNQTAGVEIQMSNKPRIYLPATVSGRSDDFVSVFGNDYMIDTETVTLNSPDIEFDDSLQQEDFEGLKFRIVGYAASAPWNVEFSTYVDVTKQLEHFSTIPFSKFSVQGGTEKNWYLPVDYPGVFASGAINSALSMNDATFILYPWNKTKYLFTFEETSEDASFLSLEKHIFAHRWYANTIIGDSFQAYQDWSEIEIDTLTPRLFDSDTQSTIVFNEVDGSPVYYGDCDTVLMYNSDILATALSLQSVLNSSSLTTSSSSYAHSDNSWYKQYKLSGGRVSTTNARLREELLVFSTGNAREVIDPVPIKYKSTRHAVIRLASQEGHIKNLYSYSKMHLQENSNLPRSFYNYLGKSDYLDQGLFDFGDVLNQELDVTQATSWSGTSTPPKTGDADIPILLIGELYREVDSTSRFGGNTEEAVVGNVWKKVGAAVSINSTLRFLEGDTYLTRYDCLKTYPYSSEDTNQLIELFSTPLETRVNLDARYDKTRALQDNTFLTPQNTNLVNRLGSEQSNNFFTYFSSNSRTEQVDEFGNTIVVSSEKTPGSVIDAWGQVNMTSNYDADGRYGGITALRTFQDNIFVFQDKAFGQVLFNNRVQIPTSDGQPIEITNGMKFQGIRYISDTIGCTNQYKDTICKSGMRMYWYYSGTKSFHAFGQNGLDNLSTRLGIRSITTQFTNKTLFDKMNNDLYFLSDDAALLYSENLDSFVSILDYGNVFTLYDSLDVPALLQKDMKFWRMFAGDYNSLLGETKPYWIKFVANQFPTQHKVFDTVQWRSDSWNADTYVPYHTFNKIRAYNQYQDSNYVNLIDTKGKPSQIKKKFNTFRALVPRDRNDTLRIGRERIRGNYSIIELKNDALDNYKFQLYDFEVSEFV